MELTIEILDSALRKVEEYRDRVPIEIRLNPTDWTKAKDALPMLGILTSVDICVPHDTMLGIPVVEDNSLLEGTMLMVFDREITEAIKFLDDAPCPEDNRQLK